MTFTHSIMFHHFHSDVHLPAQGSLSAEDFDAMIAWLTDRYEILDAEDYISRLEEGRLRPQDVCLSFDDALLCQYDVAAPVLEAHGIKAFFFVYSSVFSGKPELLEVFRYFRTSQFDTVDSFYQVFFSTVEYADVERYRSTHETFLGLDYLSAFPFYSENDKWFRYLRDKVLGETAYKNLMLDLMSAVSFDIDAASKDLWMTEDNLVALHEAGHSIGLHSYSHPTQMGTLSRDRQAEEYLRNMKQL